MAAEPLLPVYFLAGTDRAKVARALRRLRSRFAEASIELLPADTASGADAVAACNALGLFAEEGGRLVVVDGVERWRSDDLNAVAGYLADPAPGAVLALVAGETGATARLAELCEKSGRVLRYDVPKPRDVPAWVQAQVQQHGAEIELEAAQRLAELVGDDVVMLAGEVDKLAAWAGGETISVQHVEALAVQSHEAAAWALGDAWGSRDLPRLLATCEWELERERPFVLAARLAAHVGRVRAAQALVEEGLAPKEAARRLRLHEYAARKAIGHARNYSRDELDAAVVRLAELDLALKGASRLTGELELERALVELTAPAAARSDAVAASGR